MFAELLEDVVSMTDEQLDEALRRTELEGRDLAARRAALVAVIRRRRSYAIDGHRSMRGYLRATVNSGRGDIARDTKLALLVDRLPAVGEALMAGHMSIAHALELHRVSANPRIGHVVDVIAPVLIEVAEHSSYDEFRDRITEFINLVDVDGAFADLASDVEHRNARVSDVDGTLDVVAVGGHPLTAARLAAIFQGFVEAEFRRDVAARSSEHGDDADQHPLPRTAGQRRFDAMIAIFDAAAGSPEGAAAPIPTVHVLVDDRTLDETFARVGITLPNGRVIDGDEFVGDDGTMLDTLVEELRSDPEAFLSRRCETSSGSKIHPIVALQAALTGHIRRVVVDSNGTVIDYGIQRRLFTGNARAAALLLARWCTHPGCRLAASVCEVDHNDEWHAGGHTDQGNSNVECRSHNRFKHRRRWKTRRDACGRIYTLRADGTIVLPVGEREPDLTIDEMTRAARARLASFCAQLDR